MKITREEVIKRFREKHGNRYCYDKFEYVTMHSKSIIICSEHGEFSQCAHEHLKGQGCPVCGLMRRAKKRTYDTETFILKAKQKHGEKYDYSAVKYKDSQTPVTIICPKHGEFKQRPDGHLSGRGCPSCFEEKRKEMNRTDVGEVKNKLYLLYGDKYNFEEIEYVNINTNVVLNCSEHGRFKRTPYSLLKGKHCPQCMKEERLVENRIKNRRKFIEKAEVIHGEKYDYSKVKYVNCYCPVEIICPRHGSFFQKPAYHLSGNGCPECAKQMSSSRAEKEISTFLKELGITVKTHVRSILNDGNELDIFIPEKKVAIEYDGLYWHCEKNKENKNYHLEKTEECIKSGIRLIHIFEDEWVYKRSIVESRLKNILGITPKRIYARKCNIKEISYLQSKKFLEENHIQGNCVSKYNYGLYYNNELVSVMTFGRRRNCLGKRKENKKDNEYELLRFCNKIDTTVIGGASRLLKYFINSIRPENIVSYADRRWSVGELYKRLGFKETNKSAPSYFYVIGDKRYNRFSFRKDVLVKEGYDKNKSEHEIMLERNIYRIYDCGTIVYKLECK